MRKVRLTRVLWAVCLGVLVAAPLFGGSLDPTAAPGSTMHTVEEIYQQLSTIESNVANRTLSPDTPAVAAGRYASTNLTQVDSDLATGNIKSGVTVFGIAGSVLPGGVPKTGQTTSYATGDDGDLEPGVVWPSPRFTDNGDGTVTDNLTGLIWLKDADAGDGQEKWADALTICNSLANGQQGLSDGSSAGDWRLPSMQELQSLIDYGQSTPALPSGHPFTGVQSTYYWSSTTYAPFTAYAWYVHLANGHVYGDDKTGAYYFWPVRGGE